MDSSLEEQDFFNRQDIITAPKFQPTEDFSERYVASDISWMPENPTTEGNVEWREDLVFEAPQPRPSGMAQRLTTYGCDFLQPTAITQDHVIQSLDVDWQILSTYQYANPPQLALLDHDGCHVEAGRTAAQIYSYHSEDLQVSALVAGPENIGMLPPQLVQQDGRLKHTISEGRPYARLGVDGVSPQREHSCPENGCTEAFVLKKDLDRHVLSRHSNKPGFQCLCIYKEKRKDNFVRHARKCRKPRVRDHYICCCGMRENQFQEFLSHLEIYHTKTRGRKSSRNANATSR
ncbi:hypothetical protein BX600DRAFT_530211 [Xylariales sp. PMI_506]|nr:hypothetical protein BX600DRAFT_530211 [Xylariales sp. PMI_506]